MNEAKVIQRGIEFYQKGEYSKALERFTTSGLTLQGNYELMFYLGLTYARLGNNDKSIELLDSVQHLDSDFNRQLQSRLALCYIYVKLQRYADADIIITVLLEQGIEKATIYALRGYSAEQQGDSFAAVRAYKRAIELEPDNNNALNSLGYLYAKQGQNYDEALIYLRRAVSLQPKNPAYLDSLGYLCYKMGKGREAIDYLTRALALDETNETIQDHLSLVQG
ncbi:MAG: tetratricopeptide repeat protein [Spirochaetaceae bacterium]|nr:tetratricopeptide repeat protein [Spirochaetaceae bacterium]